MAWVQPAYSKSQVDIAGRELVADTPQALDEALAKVNNWRASHSFPLNTFSVTLKRKGRLVDQNCIVAQRIKRLASIEAKLRRFPGLRLSQMQDIGGCRAVVQNVEAVRQLVDIYKSSDLKHKAKIDDYINEPQISGYRGVHLVYTYNSDRNQKYNGLKVEMQIRSQYQHAWATAVETVGTFISQALKSSQGEEDWLRFFQLMGTAIAFHEGTPPVRDTPTDYDSLRDLLTVYAARLDLVNRLHTFGELLEYVGEPAEDVHYFLLELAPAANEIRVSGFRKNQLEAAQKAYENIERRIIESGETDAVLVSVESMAALRRAYPNYFLDTKVFIDLVEATLAGQPLPVAKT